VLIFTEVDDVKDVIADFQNFTKLGQFWGAEELLYSFYRCIHAVTLTSKRMG
jgi:hypothetical protein